MGMGGGGEMKKCFFHTFAHLFKESMVRLS